MTAVVGIDVGGTKIAAGLVDPRGGRLLRVLRRPTPAAEGGEAVLAACVALARRLAPDGAPVGVGLCELVDRDGRPASAVTVDWRTLDLAAAFAPVGPVALDIDVRAAARAEARFGAGRPFASFLLLTVGTGISHTLVLDGTPFAGAYGAALLTGAPLIEERSSGLALARRAGRAGAEAVLADPACDELVADAARELGLVLAALINAVDPEAVIVTGGLGMVERYRRLVVSAAREAVYADAARGIPMLPSALGTDGALLGAALLAPG